MNVDISTLPENIRNQIEELNKPVKSMFPIEPREYAGSNFQTKEMTAMGNKIDEIIVAINYLAIPKKKEDK